MSKLEELIQQYCPDGVEWKPLGEVCDFRNGFAFKSDLFKSEGSPIVRITNISSSGVDMGDVKYFHMEDYPKSDLSLFEINIGDILVAMSGATTGKIGCYKEQSKAYLNQRTGKFIPKQSLNNRFLYHFLLTQVNEMYRMAGGGAQPNLSSNDLKIKIIVPIPPLPVQEEIVRILDAFTELQTELQKELLLRKKQYQYYRDKLLSFEGRDDVEWKKLGEVLRIKNGKDYKHLGDGNVPVYGSGGIMTYVDTPVYDNPSVLIPRKGSIDKLYYVDTPFWNVDTVFYTEIDKSQLIEKYLFYVLQKEHLERLNTAGGVPSLTQGVINEVVICVPSLEEQQKIVDILDKFETLVNDLTVGIPAEIEKRRQQYEYYRDKLLTFKRKDV